jgi:hypothetical protein
MYSTSRHTNQQFLKTEHVEFSQPMVLDFEEKFHSNIFKNYKFVGEIGKGSGNGIEDKK